jgi:bifunctional non-homologous end joining protein LigD
VNLERSKSTLAVGRTARPRFIPVQLATLVAEVPDGPGWLHELKYDGYRIECLLDRGKVRLLTREAMDWTARFPTMAEAVALLPARTAVLDGELVALEGGRPSFAALQQQLSAGPRARIHYYIFDLLHLDGKDLTGLPLVERKQRLASLLRARPRSTRLHFSKHLRSTRGGRILTDACRQGYEGIVSKRAEAPYVSGRTRLWLKTKCSLRQEFVVVGYTEPKGSRVGIGSLLLAVNEGRGKLRYVGRVGTGFSTTLLTRLRQRLEALRRARSPVALGANLAPRDARWVQPKLVVEVQFTEWTRDGMLRHPAFVGLREDKPVEQVRREVPVSLRGDRG